MNDTTRSLEAAAWAAVEGVATPSQRARLEGDPEAHRLTLERLLSDTEDRLHAVRELEGPERDQVIDDFEKELAALEAAYDQVTHAADSSRGGAAADRAGDIELQASWSGGKVIVWAAGCGRAPASNDELADRLEAAGGPALGWSLHPDVALPAGPRAAALSIPVAEALGWLVAVGGGLVHDGVGASMTWLGRVAVAAARLVAQGRMAPTLRTTKLPGGKALDLRVRWVPALADEDEVSELAAAMPGPVTALARADARAVTLDVLGAVVHAIAT
ncbi:MAG: hypothetical protein M3404_10945, partial [Actinomycetota bacterium]|nr:hypothetical protein [Actinomycetota bacterium]